MEQPPDENTPANLVHAEYLTDPGRFVDESRRTSLIVDPTNGRMPALTPEAQRAPGRKRPRRTPHRAPPGGRADSYADRSLLERCITRGLPARSLPALYNNNIRIAQSPGTSRSCTRWCTRRGSCRSTAGPSATMRSYMGESRGRWEGDTLVVETRNFNGKAPFSRRDAEPRVIERYTRGGGDKSTSSSRSRTDTQWTQPWTAAYSMRPAEGELYEYACHEGNYGLRNILENARDEEKAAAEARGRSSEETRIGRAFGRASPLLCCVAAPRGCARTTRSRRSSMRTSP